MSDDAWTLDGLPLGALEIDDRMMIRRVSPGFSRLFDVDEGELVGAPLDELLSLRDRRGSREFHRRLAGGEAVDMLVRLSLGARDHLTRTRVFERPGGRLVLVEAVSGAGDLLFDLHAAARRWEQVIKRSVEGVVILDANDRIVDHNDRFFEIMDFRSMRGVMLSEDALRGADLFALLDGEGHFAALLGHLQDGSTRHTRFAATLVHRDRWLDVTTTAVAAALHGHVATCVVFRDITEQHSERALRRLNAALVAAQEELRGVNEGLDRRVRERTRDLEVQNRRLEDALTSLRRTQEKLVQAEKMASLGLLVAGIAHEIKNPLNFVNNFAELSAELLDELSAELAELAEGERGAAARSLIAELLGNFERINEHGRRADEIINSMLMHARDRPGEEVATDVNALLRDHAALAYQGFRAEDRSFQLDLSLDLDRALPRMRLAYGELARVIVNLVSNACHALRERSRVARPGFTPTLRVSSRAAGGEFEIRVRDNGTGIPASLLRRVFDPFFTTKPPGEGTGLGLSMSYDIVVSQLDGSLRVESEIDAFTEFVIRLPLRPIDGADPAEPANPGG